MNMQIPWIYIIQNNELLTKDNKYMESNFDAEFAQNEKIKNRIKKQQMHEINQQKHQAFHHFKQNSGGKTNMTNQSGMIEMNFSKNKGVDNSSLSKMGNEFDFKNQVQHKTTLSKKEFTEKMSDGTHKTKQSKKSGKSMRSFKSGENTEVGTIGRDTFEEEKTVKIYAKEKKIDTLEKEFEY